VNALSNLPVAPVVRDTRDFCDVFMSDIHRPLRIGLFGIGLDAYWPKFKGLKAKLEGFLGMVEQRLLGIESVRVC
jgi:hypothetical protein